MSSTPTLDAEYRKVITAKYLDKPCYTCGGKLVDGDYAATNTFSAWYSYCSKCASSFAAQVAALLARVEAKVAPLGSVLPANITDEVNKVTKYVEAVLNGSTDVVTAQSAKSGLFVILGLVESAVATPDPLIDALKAIAATNDRDSSFARSLVAGHAKYGSLTGPQRSAAERMITKRAAQAQARPQAQPVPHVETGLYRDDDGTIRRVYKTGRGRVSSRKYNGVDFKYEGVEGLRVVAAGLIAGTTRLLNAIEASAFGRQAHRCFNCLSIGRPGRLSDDRSLAVGYGPDCAENNGWWYPTHDEAAQILRGTLDLDAKLTQALAAGITMPAAPTEAEAEEIVESIVTGTPLDAELSDEDLYITEDEDETDEPHPFGTHIGRCDLCVDEDDDPALDAEQDRVNEMAAQATVQAMIDDEADETAYRSRMSAEAQAYEHGGTLYLDEIVDAVEPEARTCTHCHKPITFVGTYWTDATTGTDCPRSNVGHKPEPRERITEERQATKPARDLKVGDHIGAHGVITAIDTSVTPGVVYVWVDGRPRDLPADRVYNHGDPVTVTPAPITPAAPFAPTTAEKYPVPSRDPDVEWLAPQGTTPSDERQARADYDARAEHGITSTPEAPVVPATAPVCACCGNEAGTVSFVCQDAQVFKVCPPCRVMLVRRPVCPFHGAE